MTEDIEQDAPSPSAPPVAKKKKGSFKSKLLWFIAIIVCFALLRQTMMFMLLGMLPTLVIKFTDATEDNMWFKTIFCFNLAGIFPYLLELVTVHQNSIKAIQAQMTDSTMWLVVYGSAAVGYAAMWVCPIVTEFFLRIISSKRSTNHRKKLNRLHDEWGVGEHIH